MKQISRNIAVHGLAALALLAVAAPVVYAQQNVPTSFSNPLQANSIEELLAAILKFVAQIGAVIAVLYFIYGGFLYVTAQGNEDAIEKAHSTLKWAAVGTAVLLSAEVIAKIIQNTVKSVSNI